jgi:hypothetical protein
MKFGITEMCGGDKLKHENQKGNKRKCIRKTNDGSIVFALL